MSEVSSTLNTLLVSRCKSVQIGHWYRKFHDWKRRNSTIKSCIKIPILMKDQSYSRDCTKQTSKLSRPQNILLNLPTITFDLSLFAKPALLLSLFFFLTRPLIDRCQIVTDTCETNVTKFVYRCLLNHLFQYTNKNISLKPLFNLHYLSVFQLPFTRSKFVQFMGDLAVITALTR